MPSPPNFSDRLPTFNASRTLMDSFNASLLSLNSKRKKNRVATKIQALFRGHNTRRKVKASKKKKQSRIRRELSKLGAPMLDLGRLMSSSGRTTRSSRKY
jgi:hypothetical protein